MSHSLNSASYTGKLLYSNLQLLYAWSSTVHQAVCVIYTCCMTKSLSDRRQHPGSLIQDLFMSEGVSVQELQKFSFVEFTIALNNFFFLFQYSI
jgi:hypothetical protein